MAHGGLYCWRLDLAGAVPLDLEMAMKPPVSDTVKKCPTCHKGVANAGKSLCPACELVQVTWRRFPQREAAVVVIPWDAVRWWKFISGVLVIGALAMFVATFFVR